MLVSPLSTQKQLVILPLMKAAKAAGLEVHPYTFRADQGRIPSYAKDFDDLLDIFYHRVKVDGLFTDYPDKAVQFLHRSMTQKTSSD